MRTPILFPDAAALAIGFLADALDAQGDSAAVSQDVPDPRPARFVTVTRGGGVRHTLVSDAATLLVECWAATSADAHDLAQMSRALLGSMVGSVVDGVQVYRVDEVGGPQQLPDPLSEQPRYVFTLSAHFRGAAVAPGSQAVVTVAGSQAVETDTAFTGVPESSGSDKPGATNTGVPAGTSLRTLTAPEDNGSWDWNGTDVHINDDNVTLDGLMIPGAVSVYGANATISNCRIVNNVGGAYPGNVDNHFVVVVNWTWSGASVTIQDTEISGSEYGVAGYGFTLLRVDIHGCCHCVQPVGPDIVVQDSWLHDNVGTEDAHTDVIQSVGSSGMQIVHNTLEMPDDVPGPVAVISLGDSTGGGTVVDSNWISGGQWGVLNDIVGTPITVVTNNRFTRGSFLVSPGRIETPITQSGNVYDDNDEPLTL